MPIRPERAGLCATCRYAKLVVSGRGSAFVRCQRSDEDARYPRYPALPVARCAGYADAGALAPEEPA